MIMWPLVSMTLPQRHLTIDSTIIGYTDTAGFKAKNEEQRIGRDHWHYTSQLIYP